MTRCAHDRYEPIESIAGATIGWRCAARGRVFTSFMCRVWRCEPPSPHGHVVKEPARRARRAHQ